MNQLERVLERWPKGALAEFITAMYRWHAGGAGPRVRWNWMYTGEGKWKQPRTLPWIGFAEKFPKEWQSYVRYVRAQWPGTTTLYRAIGYNQALDVYQDFLRCQWPRDPTKGLVSPTKCAPPVTLSVNRYSSWTDDKRNARDFIEDIQGATETGVIVAAKVHSKQIVHSYKTNEDLRDIIGEDDADRTLPWWQTEVVMESASGKVPLTGVWFYGSDLRKLWRALVAHKQRATSSCITST